MKKAHGFTLIELLVVATCSSILVLSLTQIFFSTTRKGKDVETRDSTQQVLDALALRLKKDFERRSIAANGIELSAASGVFTSSATLEDCQNLIIRQTGAGTPPVVRKIEYKTACTGAALSSETRAALHPRLSSGCNNGPTVTRSVWENEASGAVTIDKTYPQSSICFRATSSVAGSPISAEITLGYTGVGMGKYLRKTATFSQKAGGSGVEIVSP